GAALAEGVRQLAVGAGLAVRNGSDQVEDAAVEGRGGAEVQRDCEELPLAREVLVELLDRSGEDRVRISRPGGRWRPWEQAPLGPRAKAGLGLADADGADARAGRGQVHGSDGGSVARVAHRARGARWGGRQAGGRATRQPML